VYRKQLSTRFFGISGSVGAFFSLCKCRVVTDFRLVKYDVAALQWRNVGTEFHIGGGGSFWKHGDLIGLFLSA
jgi:hypothetical protein